MVIAVLMMAVENVVQLKTVLTNPAQDMDLLLDTHLLREIKIKEKVMEDKVMDSLKDKLGKGLGQEHLLTAEPLLDRFMISAISSQHFTL